MSGRLTAAAAFLILLAGCSKSPEKRRLEFDTVYSINVVAVPGFWPREKLDWPRDPDQRAAQQQAYARHGRPDYIRKVYTFQDRIIRAPELEPTHVMIGRRPDPLWQWLYLERDLALTWEGANARESTIPDMVRIVCKYGDPNDIKEFPKPDFHQTSFFYNNHGLEVIFIDGRLSREKRISGPITGELKLR